MKRRDLVGAALVVAVGLGILWRCAAEDRSATSETVIPSPTPRAEEQRSMTPTQSGLAERETLHQDHPAEPTPAAAPELTRTPAAEVPDLAARDWLEIQVLDPEGRGVFDAELTISGLRKEGDAGSWYEMAGGPTLARSDAQGLARIDYARWVDIDGRTIEVDLGVTHPEFAPFRDSSFAIGEGQHPVVLRRGATVVVSAWTGSPENRLTDVSILMDRDSQMPSKEWVRERGGRLSTTRLLPGRHRIWITSTGADGPLASPIETFELAENEWKELDLELRPLFVLRGLLDPVVPRPVLDGHVMINLHEGGTAEDRASIHRSFEAPVRADGTFEIPGTPAASGQIIALCRGWVSRRTRVATLEEAGVHLGLEPGHEPTPEEIENGLQLAGDNAFHAQRITVPAFHPLVVAMEPTCTLEVTVRTPEDAPLAGAWVSASPNVRFEGVGSSIFPWREWNTTTDASGHARIEDLPPDGSLWVMASHDAYRMKRADRDDTPSVELVSGHTATLELVLEAGKSHGGD